MQFSLILPTHNSESHLKQCLDSIFTLKGDYEVITADGGSTDSTLSILKDYNVKLVNTKNISISNNRNEAAKHAKGDILIFIDSDCIVSPDLLNKTKQNLNHYGIYGAFSKPAKNANWIAKTWLFAESKPKGLTNWIPTATLAIKRETFNNIGGFNESLKTGEDFDLCERVRKQGQKIFNDPSIASIHLGQTSTIKEFFKKEMWRGKTLIKSIIQHGLTKSELPSTLITFYHFFGLITAILTLLIIPISTYPIVVALPLLILPSLLLAIRKTVQTKRLLYIHKFITLIFIYQIARAFSLIRYNQFRHISL